MAVKIISDSACDLPEEVIKDLDIDILPIVVIKDDKEYFDQVDIKPTEVYEGMKNGIIFKTSQVPASLLEEEFRKIRDEKDEYIYVAFSSGLSGTYQTSVLVKDSIEDECGKLNLDIVDTKAASIGQGLIVMEAGKMAKEGRTREEIIDMVKFYSEHMQHIVTVDNIEYLYRGGRISRTEALVGGLLGIKPIIEMDEEGRLEAIDKVRGHKKAIKKLLDIMEDRGKNASLDKQVIGILHTDEWEFAENLKDIIRDRFGSEEFVINNVGAAIGAHTGPGMAAIFFLDKYYK